MNVQRLGSWNGYFDNHSHLMHGLILLQKLKQTKSSEDLRNNNKITKKIRIFIAWQREIFNQLEGL